MEWKIEDLLSFSENVIYRCTIEDEDEDNKYQFILTNHRVIWFDNESVQSVLIRYIAEYGKVVGEPSNCDIGTGEYCVYFCFVNDTPYRIWFYSEDVWNEFYDELSRIILEGA